MSDYLAAQTPIDQQLSDNSIEPNHDQIVEIDKNFRLLEERLVVDTIRQKVGEVIVRKVIETEMVQVPVRREKLIVEQVGSEYRQLAEIDLGRGEIPGIELAQNGNHKLASLNSGLTVSSSFDSAKIASLLLNAIALERNQGCLQVQVTISVVDEEHRQKYQEWFDRCSQGQLPKDETSNQHFI
ncbi:YsnF/AvaK domain-containing protein [Nostoc sp. MS1]|uniref:YsnF/AvaK domain-containing protein n=1 Tax=Nostoc sp. MS1 TaxID=2764711 RepID=UPI001CC480E7|nr:DUF2382 domain-containing protein [Nostoc sp. MS1]BCL34100.1 hypothetical protein NSMS1_05470 [Nostoc sp. MS1]